MAGKQILKNNEILNRIEINGENNCFKDTTRIILPITHKLN